MTSENFNSNLRKLEMLVVVARKMSGSLHGFRTSSSRHFFATIVFARVVIQFNSFFEILKSSQRQDNNNIDYPIDIASAASILRSIVELYRSFYYGAIDEVCDDEIKLRHLKFKLKSTFDRKKIVEHFDSLFSENNNEVSNNSDSLDEEIIILRNEIKKNKAFASLDKPEKNRCLNEANAMYLTNDAIEERAGLEKNSQDGMYRFLSSEVHANPLAIEQMVGNVTNSEFAQLTLVILLDYAINYLKMYIRGMAKLFPEHEISVKA
jgi:hypothetical protein